MALFVHVRRELMNDDVPTRGVAEDVDIQMENQEAAPAADVPALKAQFDALLEKLKASGLMAPDAD